MTRTRILPTRAALCAVGLATCAVLVFNAEGQKFIPADQDTVLLRYVPQSGTRPYGPQAASDSPLAGGDALLGATSEGQGGCWAPWGGAPPPNVSICETSPQFAAASVSAGPPPPIIIRGNQLLDSAGNPIVMHGFNWFGFAQGWTMMEGLTIPTLGPPPPGGFGHDGGLGPGLLMPTLSGGSESDYTGYGTTSPGLVGGTAFGRSSLGGGGTTRPMATDNANVEFTTQSSDFATLVFRQKVLGFNAVRIPFRFSDLNLRPLLYNFKCKVVDRSQLQANLQSGTAAPVSGRPFPAGPTTPDPTPESSGNCNEYLPNDSTLNRFVWVIQYFVGAGYYVILDWHPSVSQTADYAVASNAATFTQNWVSLVSAITASPGWASGLLPGRLIYDLMNEPDIFQMKWESRSTFKDITFPPLSDLYMSAMRAMLAVDSSALFLLEGTGQALLPGTSWGNGFKTDGLVPGLSNPTQFYAQLAAEPALAARVIIGPHVYPPSISGWTTDIAGPALWSMLRSTIGAGSLFGRTYPVIIGETGSRLTSPQDITWMRDFALWLNNAGDAAEPGRQPIRLWFWWAWSPTAADTGGLVKDNYVDVEWDKVYTLTTYPGQSAAQLLQSGGGFGLQPWFV